MSTDTEISEKVGVEILRRGSMIAIGAFYIFVGNQLWGQGGYINLICGTPVITEPKLGVYAEYNNCQDVHFAEKYDNDCAVHFELEVMISKDLILLSSKNCRMKN